MSCKWLYYRKDLKDISSVSSQTNSPLSSIDPDVFLGPEFSSTTPLLPTFKIVGDNIDKEVRPKNMRSDYQARSLHYFHSYAVKDRVNLDNFEDQHQTSAPLIWRFSFLQAMMNPQFAEIWEFLLLVRLISIYTILCRVW